MNLRPLGYEPSELPNCSTPRRCALHCMDSRRPKQIGGWRHRARPGRTLPGMTEVVIYTDGACSGNPGPGGWGVVLRWNGTEKELHGGESQTTNNRMELMAAIQALEALQRPARVLSLIHI